MDFKPFFRYFLQKKLEERLLLRSIYFLISITFCTVYWVFTKLFVYLVINEIDITCEP